MAEFLIMVVDQNNPDDITKHVKLFKRGDALVAFPDGWPWSDREKTNPNWRIIRVNVPKDEADAFLRQELPVDPQDNGRALQIRQFKIDIDNASVSTPLKNWIADNARASPITVVPPGTLRALKAKKPKVVDPAA